ncbi:quinone-dependent dihydroorotate dehydrogenase [Rubrivirga sp. IMCC43871]|uniref:quinone-dependent dihydroorotate dehydrogenase n=1 Tax=Rubrivirga sp. IMCC43871 TaxID=3391575 RepID=UPI00398FCC9A
MCPKRSARSQSPDPIPLPYRLLRPLLFRFEAESAHGLGVTAARLGQRAPGVVRALFPRADPRLAQTVWGLRFASPVGLAAGFDKNAELVRFWAALGLGSAEVGSVSACASVGNSRPRAFRLPDDRALVNRMGLNNDGADAVAARLAATPRPPGFVVGVNVAKTHSPDILGDAGIDDFRASVRALAPHADYLALNVSCPNTAEGKTFEEAEALDGLLAAVQVELETESLSRQPLPLLVKLSPPPASGVDAGAVDELVAICLRHGVDGFITSNTASDRDGLATEAGAIERIGRGGLSGRPLAKRAAALTRHLYRTTDGAVPIIGVGGIDSADEAYARVRAGASLVQLYTALVYEGPGLIGRIHRGLVERLDRDGLATLADAVGLDAGE